MADTGRSLCEEAAQELSVTGSGTPVLPGYLATLFLARLNRIVNDWNAERAMIFATDFPTFTFVPGLNPHTIGPTGTWTVPQRPVVLEGATVVLTPGPNQVNAPGINLHDQASGFPLWNQSIAMPNIQTSYPTDGYYDATWPNGSFYLWPVPGTAYDCQIQVRSVLGSFGFDTVFSMPPGYKTALVLTLSESAAPMMGLPEAPPGTQKAAVAARARIMANNTGSGPIATQDAGMPRQRGTRSNWNWIVGTTTGSRSR